MPVCWEITTASKRRASWKRVRVVRAQAPGVAQHAGADARRPRPLDRREDHRLRLHRGQHPLDQPLGVDAEQRADAGLELRLADGAALHVDQQPPAHRVVPEQVEQGVGGKPAFHAEPAYPLQQAGGEHAAEVQQQSARLVGVVAARHAPTVPAASGPVTLLHSS
jgi:hypothetical protein